MRKILVLFAHPKYELSITNKALIEAISAAEHITVHDLYEVYPDANINIAYEKELLQEHDVIVWHHPFYWYSCPPLLKQWIDLVLEFNWAYGPHGNALQGKFVFNTITTGGAKQAYHPQGYNRFTLRQYLAPFDQTAYLCKMNYLPPFAVQGTHRLGSRDLIRYAEQYQALLHFLRNEQHDLHVLSGLDQLNESFITA
jgi:glutathione-regulated potassium-efflux system ancillary protein KefG